MLFVALRDYLIWCQLHAFGMIARLTVHRVRPDLRVHDLRHVALTTLLRASGGDVWLAAHMAGHTDTRQIMRVYGHHLVKDSLRAAEYMAAALATRTRRA